VNPRLFAPVRGNASLTYADVNSDLDAAIYDAGVFDAATVPDALFDIACGQDPRDPQQRCGSGNQAGNTVVAADTRYLTPS
jgi:hypothetical protein